MFNTRRNLVFLILFFLFLLISLSFFNNKEEEFVYLRILNSEDYIYLQNGNKNNPKDLILQFEDEYNKNVKHGKKKIKVIYDTFDTPENAFNILNKKNVSYDLVCISEYIVQKMANLDMLEQIDKNKIPNYFDQNNRNHCSLFIRDKLSNFKVKDNKTIFDYSLCYMWGTVGIIYNPMHEFFLKKNISVAEAIKDMSNLDVIWDDDKYKNSIMVKNSIRDIYSIGVIKTFEKELQSTENNKIRTDIFNRGSEKDDKAKEHINQVCDNLLKFKKNIRGFEIDSGKEDIVSGKIAIDIAWSGDAIYAIEKAKKENKKIFYSIPLQGTNMWFDNWVISKNSVNKEEAYAFLNFIFNYPHVIENMSYTGFTSSIAGEDIFNFFKKKYEKEDGNYLYDLTYFFKKNDSDNNRYTINIFEKDRHNLMSAQFVENDNIKNLMVMYDFGKNNDLLIEMFNKFKNDSLPFYAIVILLFEFCIMFFLFKKRMKKKIFMIK